MPKKPRRPLYLQGHYYHLYNRGTSKASIFREPENYYFVLRRIKKYRRELELSLLAYCLMPNHYHFLVRQDGEQTAGLLPQRTFNSYSKAYNKRYEHSGTLFEGPYKVVEVTADPHLRHLCRYIHANPVKHQIVQHLDEWPYSNYLEWIGLRQGTLFDKDFASEMFGDKVNYQEFVNDYLIENELPAELKQYLDY